MRSIFGWDLPPGCSYNDLPGNQEGPCDVCGLPVDDCICPECPECGAQGDTMCYTEHGLELSDEQRASKERTDREAREADERLCRWEQEEEARIEADRLGAGKDGQDG